MEQEDFELEEVMQLYRPKFLVPGYKNIFTASFGSDKSKHQIRRSSIAQYYYLTEFIEYSNNCKIQKMNTI